MVVFFVAFLLVALFFMAAEAIAERDWPRDTYKYGVIATALLIFWLAL